MEKQKRWQLFFILAVIFLTVYNILPTVFYYTKPLHAPIQEKGANAAALNIAKRINHLEADSTSWLRSFCRLLKVKPQSLELDGQNPGLITIQFKNTEDADKFRRYLPHAGELIPFSPSQLSLQEHADQTVGNKKVVVQRKIPLHFNPDQLDSFFQYSAKVD